MVLETEFQHNMSVELETNWIFDKQTSWEYRIEHYKTSSVCTQSVSFVKLSGKVTRNFGHIGKLHNICDVQSVVCTIFRLHIQRRIGSQYYARVSAALSDCISN